MAQNLWGFQICLQYLEEVETVLRRLEEVETVLRHLEAVQNLWVRQVLVKNRLGRRELKRRGHPESGQLGLGLIQRTLQELGQD